MSYEQSPSSQRPLAPCIVDNGTIINLQDMQRLLSDLGRVQYVHFQDGTAMSQGEGYILEVFADPYRSTLVANHALYLNVQSFDYLEIGQSSDHIPYFNLVQDTRQLKIVPLSNPLLEHHTHTLNAAALEAVVADVLSAGWDMQIDDEEHFAF
jgi:hypothetical protein